MTELEQAVHALTRETRTKVIQDGDGQESVAIVTHAPLLDQIQHEITSATGRGGGGGNSAGDVLNGEALYRTSIMRSAILDWVRAAGLVTTRNMTADLEIWGDAFGRTDADPAFYIRTMESWAALIVGFIDPPNRLEITDACPVCSADEFKDAEGRVLKFPVVVEFRRDRPGEARGLCRACNEVWAGVTELRKLRWDLSVMEA